MDRSAPVRSRPDTASDPAPGRWFLDVEERGNPSTDIDRRRGTSWTTGNAARVLVDGAEYFRRLYEVLRATRPGDWVYFTDWQGDPDQVLVPDGTTIGDLLGEIAKKGVHVRGLLWRSHPRLASFSEEDNFSLTQRVNRAGGEVLLDQRVRRFGSHHQKLVVVLDGSTLDGVAFEGGIDLCHGRRDTNAHLGDPQPADLDDDHYGEAAPWHDVQLEVAGPAVHDIAWSFAERWRDRAPLDSPTPWRLILRRASAQPSEPGPLAPDRLDGTPAGTHAVQVLRTYPKRRSRYPFAEGGERSIARAYENAFAQARRLVYIEDQYMWSLSAIRALTAAIRREPSLLVVLVVPRYPDPGGAVAGPASSYGRRRVLQQLRQAGGDRIAVYDLENAHATPIYVHSKLCVVDDIWMVVGSDNLNRRSWTHDSELSCAVIDEERDERAPADPAGCGEGARRLARETRVRVAIEHLGLDEDQADDLVDPERWFARLRAAATALDRWHAEGRLGLRPPGHLRAHPPEHVPRAARPLLRWMHTHLLDPDGRPRKLRRHQVF
jgi:phosphatidylserine/phosphatidylglycerophosphate/cardiolipin synthase-like enzyme